MLFFYTQYTYSILPGGHTTACLISSEVEGDCDNDNDKEYGKSMVEPW